MYYNGTQMYEILYSLILAYPMSLYLFIPIYYDLGITSVYQVIIKFWKIF